MMDADFNGQQVNPLPEMGNDEARKAHVLRAIDEAWNRAELLQRQTDAMESPEGAWEVLRRYFEVQAYAKGLEEMAILARVFRDRAELEKEFDEYFDWKWINRGRE